jgi:hypothetical protein
MDSEGMRRAAGTMSGAAEQMGHATSSMQETVHRLCVNLEGLQEALNHDRRLREEQVERLEQIAELNALHSLLYYHSCVVKEDDSQSEYLGNKLEDLLKARGVI